MATESGTGISLAAFGNLRPANNITPFTYRDGTTMLQLVYALRDYITVTLVPAVEEHGVELVEKFNETMKELEKHFENERELTSELYATFTDQIRGLVEFINNKTGAADIQRKTLTENFTIGINPEWPTNQPVYFVLTQDSTGGRVVTLGDNITGPLEVNSAPGSATEFILMPTGGGKWKVAQVPWTRAGLDTLMDSRIVPALTQVREAMAAVVADTSKTNRETKLNVENGGYLFANFVGNGATGEHLNLFYSPDGKTLFGGGEANPVYIPADGGGLRDPSIIYRNNRWYVAYTSKDGQNKDMAIAVSETGGKGTWSLLTKISAASINTLNKLWAPEFIEDGDDLYIFFSSITAGNVGSMAYMKANDNSLTSWSAPVPLPWTAAPLKTYIDGVPVKGKDGKWYMFYSGGESIDRAVSDKITGPWTIDRTGNWAGWGAGIEGPTIVRDGDLFRAYFDRYVANTGLHWSEAADLNGPWSNPVKLSTAPNALRKGETIRHGSVHKLSNPEARNKAMAAVSMRTAGGNHTEFSNGGTETVIGKSAFTDLQGVYYDEAETTSKERVTYDPGTHNFKLNELCMYSISATINIGNNGSSVITNVTRGLADMTQAENVNIVHARGVGGVEDKFIVSIPNFKPRYAGEEIKFRMLAEWNGGATAKLLTRIRFTKIGEI